jgi:hypothetical protein
VRGWSDLGARTADCWLLQQAVLRRPTGQLMPLPMFFVAVLPYGHMIGWTCTQHPVSHIALCWPDTGKRTSTADRDTLLHEMVHALLDQQGKDTNISTPVKASRDEIMRLHFAIPGACTNPGRSKVTKINGRSVGVQEGDMSQALIAGWPRSCGIEVPQ